MYVGWDRASEPHDITVMDDDGSVVDRWALCHAGDLDRTIARLARHGDPAELPVAIEITSGVVVAARLGRPR